ncbi:MAG: MarR family transcriptional regulator [Pedobacter sp.]
MNIHQQAIGKLFLTYNWYSDRLKKSVAPYDITTQQFNVLRILQGQYPRPSTVSFVKETMLDKMCDASRIVDRLVQKKLIIKDNNSRDKRAVDIIISEKGLSLLERIDHEVSIPDIISKNLTLKEAQELNQLLDKVRG